MSSLAFTPDVTSEETSAAAGATKVLHVVNGEYYAGAERVQDLLALHLPKLGFDVGFVCVKPDRFGRCRQATDAPLWEVPVRHPCHRSAMKRIAGIVRREGFDLLHSHTPRSGWAALAVGRRTGRPVVHTVHDVALGSPAGLAQKVLARYTCGALARADYVVAVSPAALDVARRHRLGRRRGMVRNGVPSEGPLGERPLPNEWTVGIVALFRPCKGIEVLVKALGHLRRRSRPVRLKVIGRFVTPAYEKEIRALIASQEVGGQIEFLGFAADVPAQLRQLDLFVLTSTGPEGLPMVLMEAMACGVPIIGSNVAGIRDVVRDGLDGRLVAAGDDRQLAEAVEGFLLGQYDWRRMRRHAHERHEQEFTAERMARETAEVYRSLLPPASLAQPNAAPGSSRA
ncbi:MAG: glycosyltransferase family 4 protein [Planctomycetota bacterium]